MANELVKLDCYVCGKEYEGIEPERCCDGRECGCMGLPVEPCICSQECGEKFRGRELTPIDIIHPIPNSAKLDSK